MKWCVSFHLNVGYLLLGVSWKTCTRKFQMSRTRSSKFTDIFLNKTRIGSSSGIKQNYTSEIWKFQSWKFVHFKYFCSRRHMNYNFVHLSVSLFVTPLFPGAVHFNPCLIFRSFHCRWDLKGMNFHALIQSGKMLIANLRFRASRSIWRMMTKKRKQNDSSGSRMLPCIVSWKLINRSYRTTGWNMHKA